jgi:hypothetical protein
MRAEQIRMHITRRGGRRGGPFPVLQASLDVTFGKAYDQVPSLF